MADYTLTYDEKVKGWTSFHSFLADGMVRLNNEFFSFKNGQLYVHHSEDVDRNNFYNTAYPSKVSVVINDSPSENKIFKTLYQEGTVAWNATLQAYRSDSDDFSQSTIDETEFKEKEGQWYGYARRNEQTTDFSPKSVYGVGIVKSIAGSVISVTDIPASMSIGDLLYNKDSELVGTIDDVDRDLKLITLSSTSGLQLNGFVFGSKSERVEGAAMRGYTLRVDLENNDTSKRELYAVGSEVVKSSR